MAENATFKEVNQPRPASPESIPCGYLLQPKLDGVRGTFDPSAGVILSRTGSPIEAVQHVADSLSDMGVTAELDGEIWNPSMTLEQIVSKVAKKREAIQLGFHVFDIANDDRPQIDRQQAISEMELPASVHIVGFQFGDPETVFGMMINEGFEGMVARDPNCPFTCYKIKPFEDAEFRFLGASPCGGSVRFECEGKEFKIGANNRVSSELASYGNEGDLVTIRFAGRTKNGFPRCPKIIRVREAWDLAKD